MFDTIADMLRGSAPDDLAHALGTDRTQTRRAMEIGLPALITGLRDKTLEPGGAQNLSSMLDRPSAAVPDDLDAYLAAGDPSLGASMLDVAFGDRGEPALAALSSASGLTTRLLAQVMSVLAPLATGTVAVSADRDPESLRAYLAGAVDDLQAKGFGRVVELVSPAGLDVGADAVLLEPDTPVVVEADEPVVVESDGDGEIDLVLEGDEFVPGDADQGADVVEGAFGEFDPDPAEVRIEPAPPLLTDDPTEAIELGGSMPDFDSELAGVAPAPVTPAGVPIAPEAQIPASVAVVDPVAPAYVAESDPEIEPVDLEGRSLSGMGWIWWLVAAVLGIILLFFVLTQCGGSDGDDLTTGDPDVTAVVEEPTPNADELAAQAALDAILADYPNVVGRMQGSVAVLNGTVADETERAVLDQAVRAAGLSVQNNVTAAPAGDVAVEGFSINDIIDAQPELTTLRAVLDQAGLGEALSGGSGNEFTLFAPTNEAFAAIQEQVAELQGDPGALQEVLQYHLLVGSQDAAALAAAGSVPTQLEGQSIEIDSSGPNLVLNGTSQVVASTQGRNGTVHIVSAVLLPNTAVELPEEIGVAIGISPITFSSGTSDLTDADRVELDKVAAFLLENPGDIIIGGHTDSDGDAGFNLTLSQDRADAVRDYLAAQGVPAESMTAVGFGEEDPLVANDTPENKARNRRIEFRPA